MLKINEIYTKVISENVSYDISALTKEKLETLINRDMEQEHHIVIHFSKFIKLVNDGKDAKYAIVTYDVNEPEYLVNYMTVTDEEGKGFVEKDTTSIPEETFEKLEDAVEYVKSINESDIFGNPDKNSQGTIIPDIKEADEKQISIEDIGKNYSDWLDYVIKQKNIGANIIDSDPKQAPQALVTIIKALGYIPAPNLIEKFLKETPQLYKVIVDFIKKTLDSDEGIDWAMSLEHTLKNDYNVKTSIPNEEADEKTVKEDEIEDLDAAIKQDLDAKRKAVRESADQEELFDALSKLVDAEYESLQDFPNHEKLYDYVIGMFPKIEPETVEKVWNIYFA